MEKQHLRTGVGSDSFLWVVIKGDVGSLSADRLGQGRIWLLFGSPWDL